MRILLLTQFFDPEPTFKGLVFAKSLAAHGHEVSVVTGFPNYPGGKVYPGYTIKPLQKENIEGIKIYRVPLFPSHGQSKIGRIFNYVSFCVSSFFASLILGFRVDVIYVYHPPATVGASAALAGFLTRTPFVLDIQDLWPDTLSATGMISNTKLLKTVGVLCRWIYSRASKIAVLSPGFKKLLIERGVTQEKVEVIYNWCDEKALQQSGSKLKADFGMNNRFNIVFAGTMGKAQALNSVLQAARIVFLKNSNILFSFVGGGIEVESLKSSVQQQRLPNVQFIPHMPMTEVGSVLRAADVLLVHLKKDPLFSITIPSKTQAYLAMGKPVLMAVDGDAADLVKEADGGLVVVPENAQAIADAILEFASMKSEDLKATGQRGSRFYFEKMSLNMGTLKFVELFRKAIHEKA